MRSVSARQFAEPWPERPAAKRREREKWLAPQTGRLRSVSPWPGGASQASHQTPETTYGSSSGSSGSSGGSSDGPGTVVVVVSGTVVVVVVVVFLDR